MAKLFHYNSVKLYDGGVYLVDCEKIVPSNEIEKLSQIVTPFFLSSNNTTLSFFMIYSPLQY